MTRRSTSRSLRVALTAAGALTLAWAMGPATLTPPEQARHLRHPLRQTQRTRNVNLPDERVAAK